MLRSSVWWPARQELNRDLWIERRIASVAHPLRIPPVNDEASDFQRAHVPRHARLACAELLHQLAHAMLLPVPQQALAGRLSRHELLRRQAGSLRCADRAASIEVLPKASG
jgi:hypothetical protein